MNIYDKDIGRLGLQSDLAQYNKRPKKQGAQYSQHITFREQDPKCSLTQVALSDFLKHLVFKRESIHLLFLNHILMSLHRLTGNLALLATMRHLASE